MSDALITIRPPDLREIARGVALMRLPPNLRKRLLARMGRLTVAQAQKNVREQKTVDGSRMTPRKRKPPKKRRVYHKGGTFSWKRTHPEMLHDLVRSKWLGVKADSDKATVSFFRNTGCVGYKHQWGTTEVYMREKIAGLFPPETRSPHFREFWEPCGEKQAQAIAGGGFPQSVEWCMEHLRAGDAFRLYSCMKMKWDITVPARPFLGVPDETKRVWSDELLRGIYERFKAKNHKNLLT